jgi:prepilin-type N-terminal cleavage/methylation domain-containing protein/prepilin-type processing-associated H-X9-DG protein
MNVSQRRAFTLIELLISVAILALLVGLLLPGLHGAREQAKAAVCASNLRQLALANQLYADDHEQCYCPGAADFMATNLHRWHGTRKHASDPFVAAGGPLVPYLGLDGAIRACPALRPSLPQNEPRRFEKNCGGYGYNQAYIGVQLETSDTGLARIITDRLGAEADHVRRPTQTLMFADTAFVSGDLIEYSFAEPRFFPTLGTRPDPSIHFRHRHRANVAWCDGHVDAQRRTFTWCSGLYVGDPAQFEVGWFGADDDNGWFDLE